MPKRVVVIGATGNQGGSVVRRFLADPSYQVTGVTRDPSAPAAKELASQGVTIVQADLNDVSSLTAAFKGANLIFTVTNYWEPFFHPGCRKSAADQGLSIREYAGDIEELQGRNLADAAAATVDSLDDNGFIVSTLSHATECSGGEFDELYHFDAKANVFPWYVNQFHPKLAAKMSCVQTGFFTSSYKLIPKLYFQKLPDGTYQMSFPQDPDIPVPHLAVNADAGNFVYAVSKMGPGKDYMAGSTVCSWTDYMKTWSRVTGKRARYKQITLAEFIDASPDREFGREVGDMFCYSSDPGYDGGMELLGPEEIKAYGIECPMTSLREWMEKEDWSDVLLQ